MKMQQVILDEAQKIVEAREMTFANNVKWANTGIVYAVGKDLQPMAAFTYNFQDTYADFTLTDGSVEPIDLSSTHERPGHQVFRRVQYNESDKVWRFLAALEKTLDTVRG